MTKSDRAINTIVGASLGLFAGGALVTIIGVIGSVAVGSTSAYITLFGGSGAQTAAIGALAFNAFAMVIAPALGVEVEPIEFDS